MPNVPRHLLIFEPDPRGHTLEWVEHIQGMAAARPGHARRAVGVSAQGMNACPCAQGLVREQAEAALAADGFTDDEIARIVATMKD